MRTLINNVIDWGIDKGIFSKGTTRKQVLKTQEETGELVLAVGEGDIDGIMDGIGDVTVTLILLAEMYGLTLEECLAHAYKEIKDRTGEMKDGTFVKDK
jgi:NTP pyrophosphatase (non-canonical NTP hydrolase)